MTVAAVTVAALFWLGGLSRLPAAARSRRRQPLCIALLCFAAALTFDISPVYMWFDRVIGAPNLADLVEHCFGVIGVFALLLTIEDLTDSERNRRPRLRLLIPLVAVAALTGLFFAAGTRGEATDFTRRYGRSPFVMAYWAITIAYFAVVLVALGRLVVRHSARCSRAALRTGLRLVGAGVAVGVLYSALKIVQLAVPSSDYPDAVSSMILWLGAALIGFGLLLPVLESAWTTSARRFSDRLALLRLRRLWLDVTEHVPDVVLDGHRSLFADLVAPQASYRLYRRVIEIRDVQLAAETAPHSLQLPSTVLALLERDGSRPAEHSVRDELASLLELARIWGTGGRRTGA